MWHLVGAGQQAAKEPLIHRTAPQPPKSCRSKAAIEPRRRKPA